MKLKLTSDAYANFTGRLGTVDFTDGVSNYSVSPEHAQTVRIVTGAEEVPENDDTSALTSEISDLQSQLATANTNLTNLQAEYDAYKTAHPAE